MGTCAWEQWRPSAVLKRQWLLTREDGGVAERLRLAAAAGCASSALRLVPAGPVIPDWGVGDLLRPMQT